MQITNRKEAAAAGLGQYFTGKPCKYGHVAHRYTQSGSCSQCVSDAAAAARSEMRGVLPRVRASIAAYRQQLLDDVQAAKTERADALAKLVEVKLPIHLQDLNTVFETAAGLCLAECPTLKRVDVWSSNTPIKGFPLYRVTIPVKHVELIQSIANQLWSSRGPDLARVHDRVAHTMEKEATDQVEEPPENYK